MPLTDTSKINIAFKKLGGKAQTATLKEIYNESKGSAPTITAGTVPILPIPNSPNVSALYNITSSNNFPAIEMLRCPLVLDPSSNNQAYFVTLPAVYESSSSNPRKSVFPFLNNQPFCDTAGRLQIMPVLYGNAYEARLYSGGSATVIGSGTYIPLGDARNWVLDYFNGILFQEQTGGLTPSYLECLTYIGYMTGEDTDGAGNVLIKQNDNAGTINYGQVAYFKPNGNVDLATATTSSLSKYSIGIVAETSIASGASGTLYYRPGTVVSGFSGLTPGRFYYIHPSSAGSILLGDDPSFVSGMQLYQVGRAINATQLEFMPEVQILL